MINFSYLNLSDINSIFTLLCEIESDIHEHLPVLKKYAEECETITEMGVCSAKSTYALIAGKPKKLTSIDYRHPDEITGIPNVVDKLYKISKDNNIDFTFILGSTTEIEIEDTDLLFIDTLHAYNQLKKELELHGNKAKKYIIFHDTTLFENKDEDGGNIGLWKAISEFLEENKHWVVNERFYNNNGLTILKRKND
jgi:hypothetical protein